MSKVTTFAKLTAQEGRGDAVRDALVGVLPAASAEPGTEVYAVCSDETDRDVVWMFELYADRAALDEHFVGPALAELFETLGPLLAKPPMLVIGALNAAVGLDPG